MKQFTFRKEGSNRILSKVQKSFWSCTHVNSCQKYTKIYQSTYFIEYLILDYFKYSRIKKIHQGLEKITRIDQKHQNSLCLDITLIVNYKIYTIYQFTYFIYYLFQDKFKYPKMM